MLNCHKNVIFTQFLVLTDLAGHKYLWEDPLEYFVCFRQFIPTRLRIDVNFEEFGYKKKDQTPESSKRMRTDWEKKMMKTL